MYIVQDLSYRMKDGKCIVFVIYAIKNRPYKAFKNVLETPQAIDDIRYLERKRTPTSFANHLSKVARYGECQYFDTLEDARRWIEE